MTKKSKHPAKERKKRVRKQAKKMLAEISLSELRESAGMSQTELAEQLGIAQPSLSQMESQDDMRIKTLDRLINALGGELVIMARMPTGDVRLNQFESLSGS